MDSPESDGAEGGGEEAREEEDEAEEEEGGEGKAVVDTAVEVVEDDFDDDLTEEWDLEGVVFLPLDELEDDFAFEETIVAGGADAGAEDAGDEIDVEAGLKEYVDAETSDKVSCGSSLIAEAGGGDDAVDEGVDCASQMVEGEADDA